MRNTGLLRFGVAMVVAGCMMGAPIPASAQDDGLGSEAGVFEDAPVESSAPGEDLDAKIRGLRWGVGISTVAIPLGAGLLVGGAAACVGDLFGDGCTTGQTAMISLGIVFMIAGTGGMIASAILLRRRKLERKGLHADRRFRWSQDKGAFVF